MIYTQILKSNTNSDDLNAINKLSRRPLSKDEIFTFSIILCDNDIDRDFECFSDEALIKLKKLFIGKTGIFDHTPTGANQTSRIFFTDVISNYDKKNSLDKPYKYLLAKAYMTKSHKNHDLILDIDAGIKKEISIGCSIEKKICSICGTDTKLHPCNHSPGNFYNIDGEKKLCFLSLINPLDAYEWSFVAIPAQVNAGVIKNFSSLNLNINSINPDQIIKSLSTNSNEFYLSNTSAKSLINYISCLQNDIIVSNSFIGDLKSDVSKMLIISHPYLSNESINNIIKGLSISELKEFKNNLSKELDFLPSTSQLASEPVSISPNDSQMLKNDAYQFKS